MHLQKCNAYATQYGCIIFPFHCKFQLCLPYPTHQYECYDNRLTTVMLFFFAFILKETDFNGTVGFDNLCKHIKDGHKTCRDIEEFFKKRFVRVHVYK